jgi:hypothetical protein
VELVEFFGDQHQHEALRTFAIEILSEIKADQQVLRGLAEEVGGDSSGLKGLAAWFAEKVTRWKLRAEDKDDLGTFEALEFLGLGISGNWRFDVLSMKSLRLTLDCPVRTLRSLLPVQRRN